MRPAIRYRGVLSGLLRETVTAAQVFGWVGHTGVGPEHRIAPDVAGATN